MVETRLLEVLDVLADRFGKPEILVGPVCMDEARRLYRIIKPSSLRSRPSFPMLGGKGVLTSWALTAELRAWAESLDYTASTYSINSLLSGTLISPI